MTTSVQLPSGTWVLDTSATTVTISVKKLGFIEVPATLTVSSGTIDIDDDHRVTGVDIVADAASYTSKNPKRNEHVVGSDFLDAANHATIGFQASRVVSGASGYTADGTVTIKGKSAPIAVVISDVAVDGDRGSFTATATIDRNEIGVDKMPSFVIGRNLQLSVSAAATKTS